jgi:hypothetical protein
MSNKLNETYKKHLGLLHKKLNEDTGDIISMIERYIEIIETLKSVALSYDGDTPALEDEKRNIKSQIINKIKETKIEEDGDSEI